MAGELRRTEKQQKRVNLEKIEGQIEFSSPQKGKQVKEQKWDQLKHI